MLLANNTTTQACEYTCNVRKQNGCMLQKVLFCCTDGAWQTCRVSLKILNINNVFFKLQVYNCLNKRAINS